MRLQDTIRPLWLLPILLAGCSSTVGSRLGGTTPQSSTIAVVGDHPLPASTGEPGSRVAADSEEPEPRRNPATRISGRVVDEAGDPVAGATVRLADGGTVGGKEIVGRTDRSGAFTLNGLRPGSSYELIAESDDEHGPIVGRIEATTAQTGLKIALSSEDRKPTSRRSARPAKSRPISNREDLGEAPGSGESSRINREDIATPAEEADAIDQGPPEPTRAGRPQLSPPSQASAGRIARARRRAAPKNSDIEEDSASSDIPVKRRKPAKQPIFADPDDEENPLPPALNRGGAASSDDPEPARPASARSNRSGQVGGNKPQTSRESGEIALAPQALPEPAKSSPKIEPETVVAGELRSLSTLLPDLEPSPTSPPPMPPVGADPVKLTANNEDPTPTPSPPSPVSATQVVPPSNPAPQPVFASQALALKAVEPVASTSDYNPFASLPVARVPGDRVAGKAPIVEPTSAESPPVVASEPSKKKWGELAASDRPAAVVPPAKATLASTLFRRIRPPVEVKEPSVASCSYDPRLRKLNDFRLPDLEGKPVQFHEIDADFVLLDFWGTWCEPCLDAIPHLVELQKKYGPGRFKVVGIACEQATPEHRKAKIDEVSRRLGINYPVLLSTMDGKPCPVQQAFQVQAMPTMILVDRKGEVLWRNSGSTPASDSRLDKVLALAMSRNDSVRR